MRILLAEDEIVFSTYLAASLSAQDWDVKVATAGHQAIDIGVTFRPQVLVADWLLRNRYDGLEVSNALRTIDPGLKTILITSYCSADLRAEAVAGGVFRVLEKPVPLPVVADAVRDALSSPPADEPPIRIPVALVETDGRIVHVNSAARTMFRATRAGAQAETIRDLFDEVVIDRLGASTQAWMEVAPIAEHPILWRVRSRRVDGTWLMVMVQSVEMNLRDHPYLGPLLEIPKTPRHRWPFNESVLVVTRAQAHRKAFSDAIEARGSQCYRAETPALAIKLLEADPDIGAVVLDYDWPTLDVAAFIRDLRRTNTLLTIVGTGRRRGTTKPTELGFDCYLQHPWSLDQLVNALAEVRDTPLD